MVQWLGLHAFTAKGVGSVPGKGNKILQDAQLKNKTNKNPLTLNPHVLSLSAIWLNREDSKDLEQGDLLKIGEARIPECTKQSLLQSQSVQEDGGRYL